MDFIGEIGKKIAQATRIAPNRPKDEDASSASELASAQELLDRQLIELGRAYYESTLTGAEVSGELVRRVQDTMTLIDSITKLQDRVPKLVKCPACGSSELETAKFCSNCGKAMPEKSPSIEDEEPDAEAEYCPNCGAMRQDDAKFCDVCGQSFDADAQDDAPADRPAEIRPDFEPLEEPEDFDRYEGD